MSWDNNPYSEPENFGLETIAELDRSCGAYEFDHIVIWRRLSDQAVVWATDSGCSCPSPFQNTGVQDLKVLNENTWPEFERDAIGDEWSRHYTPKQLQDFLATAKGAMAS